MKSTITLGAVALSAALLTACGADSTGTGTDDSNNGKSYTTASFDTGTSGQPQWAYYDFDEGKAVTESDDWDIAFNRMKVKLNAPVKSAIADKKDEFYQDGKPLKEAFINADAAIEEQAFYDVITVTEDTYMDNGIKTAIDDSWYVYNPQTHGITANADNYWILKSSTADSYAKFRASSVDAAYLATFEFYVQDKGEDSFNDQPASIAISLTTLGDKCYDFDTAGLVDCSASEWDVKFEIVSRAYNIKLNGGVSGSGQAAGYGPVAVDDFTTGTDQNVAYAYVQDADKNAFSENTPWEYGVNGGHEIWPNYRTYAIDLGEGKEQIKLQLTSYYDSASAKSGTVTMRYMTLSDNDNGQ